MRLTAAARPQLFVDAQSLAEWRRKGFHGVLPERGAPPPEQDVLLRTFEAGLFHDDRLEGK